MHTSFLLIGLLFSLLFNAAAQSDFPESGSVQELKTKVVFPEKLGAFLRYKEHNYGNGLGMSVPYKTDSATFSIYLYDLDKKTISTGIESPLVIGEMSQAKEDIFEAKRQRKYTTVKHIKDEEIVIGSNRRKLLKSSFVVTKLESTQGSFILLTGYKKNFLKLRCTYDVARAAEVEKSLEPFYQALARILDEAEKE